MLKKTMINFVSEKCRIFINDRQGGILFSFIALIPVFIGLIYLSFEFSHFIQKRAKLSDSLEQAALALTTENNNGNGNASKDRNNHLVTSYAQSYLPSASFSQPRIVNSQTPGYTQYNVSLEMNYPLALLNTYLKQNTSPTLDVNENGSARRYISSKSEPIDVLFVSDFSGSMNEYFHDDQLNKGQTKIKELKDILVKLNKKIFANDGINAIGFVPFSWGTRKTSANGQLSSTYCHLPYSPKKIDKNGHYLKRYTVSNLKNIPGLDDLDEVDNIAYGKLSKDQYNTISRELKERRDHSEISPEIYAQADSFLNKSYKIEKYNMIINIVEENIDYKETINSISRKGETIDIPMDDVLDPNLCLKNTNAKTLNFLSNSKGNGNVEKIIKMNADGGTLASSGMLVGNRMLMKSPNKNKLMIILSDGDDNKQKMSNPQDGKAGVVNITQKLIAEGMCQRIQDNGIKIVFIGIGYIPDDRFINWEKDCVGAGNFYLAQTAHELEISLERTLVIDDEVGRNIPKN